MDPVIFKCKDYSRIKRITKSWIEQGSFNLGDTEVSSAEWKNVQGSFQNSFFACRTLPLILTASAEVSLRLFSTRVIQGASMFHDLCPLIWAAQKKINNCTLVTRLTFSRHVTLFRAQSIKSDHQISLIQLFKSVCFCFRSKAQTWLSMACTAMPAFCFLLSAIILIHTKGPLLFTGSSGKWSPEGNCTLRRLREKHGECAHVCVCVREREIKIQSVKDKKEREWEGKGVCEWERKG